MTVIKRYPNRKLYNTSAKQYVTLEGIAALIRQGEEVQILDHATGEDLTAVTLTQIIFEQEKKKGGFLPRSVLTGLVQSGGQTLNSLRRSLATSLGLRQLVGQEIDSRLHRLMASGQLENAEGARLRTLLLSIDDPPVDILLPSEAELERLLADKDLPTQNDIQQLNHKLEQLVNQLETLAADHTSV